MTTRCLLCLRMEEMGKKIEYIPTIFCGECKLNRCKTHYCSHLKLNIEMKKVKFNIDNYLEQLRTKTD